MGARLYDPIVGRWLTEDPVQDQYFNPLSLNFYAYVQNNPTSLLDPSGLETCDQSCLEELNRQRQEAAKSALKLDPKDPVRLYKEYLGISRAVGHDVAMELLPDLVSSSSNYIPTASINGRLAYRVAGGVVLIVSGAMWVIIGAEIIASGGVAAFIEAGFIGANFGLTAVGLELLVCGCIPRLGRFQLPFDPRPRRR